MQRTLVLIKPDAVQRRLIGKIINRFEEKGLEINRVKADGYLRRAGKGKIILFIKVRAFMKNL